MLVGCAELKVSATVVTAKPENVAQASQDAQDTGTKGALLHEGSVSPG